MKPEELKAKATEELRKALGPLIEKGMFAISPGGVLNEDTDESISIAYEINFQYGNCHQTHHLIIGWTDTDGIGLEYGEDGEIETINKGNLIARFYFDLALEDLNDKYIK